MSWQLTFQAANKERVHRYFWCCTIMDRLEPDLWWCDELGLFISRQHPEYGLYGTSSHSKPIRTLKAFKRFLRKHPELMGRTVRLVNRYVGYDVEARYEA